MQDFENDLLTRFENPPARWNAEELKQLSRRLPDDYFTLSDPDDLRQQLEYLDLIIRGKRKKILYESDIETFALLEYDYSLLLVVLKSLLEKQEFLRHPEEVAGNLGAPISAPLRAGVPPPGPPGPSWVGAASPAKLFRLYRDKEKAFFILGSYHKLAGSPRAKEANLQAPDWENLNIIKNNPDLKERIAISTTSHNRHTHMEIHLVNTSLLTLFKNLGECLEQYEYSFIELLMQEKLSRKIKNIFQVSVHFFEPLEESRIAALKKDLERYLQSFISYRSILDIIGPVMVGPSSSHTAGANRIGQIAGNIITALLEHKKIDPIEAIKIKLLGSFRETGVGHHTPEAIIGGICGYSTDHEKMIETGEEALKAGENFRFKISKTDVKFGGFVKGSPDDDTFYKDEHNNNIAEITAVTGKGELTITGFSIGGGSVEIRYINRKRLNEIIDGKKTVFLDYETLTIGQEAAEFPQGIPVLPVDTGGVPPRKEYVPGFNTFEEMQEVFGGKIKGRTLIQKIIDVEQQVSGTSKVGIYKAMKNYWKIMKRAMYKGFRDQRLTPSRLVGQDARKIRFAGEKNVLGLKDNIYGIAMANAVSVSEVNAKSGVIVACPTGGSCGIVPAVIKAWAQTHPEHNTQRLPEALMVAGFMGMILFDDVPTAGADLGCQAEIGGGAAMAAAALVFLEGGTLGQMVEAFTLALKNSMGLVCDPVAGLVEVPCVKRNGIYAAVAISAAFLAIAGVKSMISPDEVVLAVKEVGEKMSGDYKETARGGLAQTRDGKKIDGLFAQKAAALFK